MPLYSSSKVFPKSGYGFSSGPQRGHVPAAETFAVGLEDDDFDLLVAVGLVQAIVDFGDQHRILGIGLVDPIQDDPRNRRFALIDDRFEDAPLHAGDTTGRRAYSDRLMISFMISLVPP